MGMQEGVGAISWKDIYEWYNTPEFMLVNFKVKGQQGAYICRKRLDSKNFSSPQFASIWKQKSAQQNKSKPVLSSAEILPGMEVFLIPNTINDNENKYYPQTPIISGLKLQVIILRQVIPSHP